MLVSEFKNGSTQKTNAFIIGLLLALTASFAHGAQWQARVTDDAAVEVLCDGVPVIRSNYVFWGPKWKWAGAEMNLGTSSKSGTTFVGRVAELGLNIEGVVQYVGSNQLRYKWNIRAANALEDIVGGGFEFRLDRSCAALGENVDEPRMMAKDRGWSWRIKDEDVISFEFSRPLSSIYFERGSKDQIRAMFVGQKIQRGLDTVSMTVTLPKSVTIEKPLSQRYGTENTFNWYKGALQYDKSPMDLSFLNHKPAGKFGFVKAKGDKLTFENGAQAKFWGGNIAAYAIFVDKDQIETQAKRIAQLGYNLMRIHHHDSTGWVGRTVIDSSKPDSQHFDEEVMDRLDYWIKCLRDQGVYVWLDLHVGRLFKEGDEIGEGFAEMMRRGQAEKGTEGKGYCYFNPRIEELMKQFNEKYLSHVNKYTNLAYKDDPAIMGLLITNENDITSHFGNLMLADKNNPYHNKIFEDRAKQFAPAAWF